MRFDWISISFFSRFLPREWREHVWGVYHGYKAARYILVGGGIALLAGLFKSCDVAQNRPQFTDEKSKHRTERPAPRRHFGDRATDWRR